MSEMCVIGHATTVRNLGQCAVGCQHEPLSHFDAPAQQPTVGCDTKRTFECSGKMAAAEVQ